MEHLDDDSVRRFTAGDLQGEELARVEQHVRDCVSCAKRVTPTMTAPTRSERPSAPPVVTPTQVPAGATLGRYRVEGPLGEGGMGVVLVAVDPELGRRVALKLVRVGAGSESEQRLLREAQAMARLSHPNVVAVHDVGTYQQKVFLAMELVDGQTLRRWLKEAPRAWPEVLRAFLDAGRGLAAAHAAGIVHRDFKADNVLIDKRGAARVTDFGLARALDDREPEQPVYPSPGALESQLTEAGTVMGTVPYMAPEQLRAERGDARTDQFSYCVALYEAMYGERPFAESDLSRAVVRAPPATKVPPWIRRALLKGLSASPADRWPSMDALIAELSNDPALQRRKWLFRAALAFMAAVAVLAVSMWLRQPVPCDDGAAALSGIWDDAVKASIHAAFTQSGKPYAEASFASLSRRLDETAAAWVEARREACRALVNHEQPEEPLHLRLACLERQRTAMKWLSAVLVKADARVVQRAVQAAGEIHRPAECSEGRALMAVAKLPADPKILAEIEALRERLAEGTVLRDVGRLDDANKLLEPIGARAAELKYRPLEAEALLAMGLSLSRQGDRVAAEEALTRSLAAAEAGGVDAVVVKTCCILSTLASVSGRSADAQQWLRRAEAVVERMGGGGTAEADVAYARGSNEVDDGNPQAIVDLKHALALREQYLGPEHDQRMFALTTVGNALDRFGQPYESRKYTAAAVSGWVQTLGEEHPLLVTPLMNLGENHTKTGELDEADRLLSRALALGRASMGERSYWVGYAWLDTSRLRLEQGRVDDALTAAETAASILKEGSGDKAPDYGEALVAWGAALAAKGDASQAEARLKDGIAVEELSGQESPLLPDALTRLGEVRLAAGQPAAAIAPLERALRISAKFDRYPGELARTRLALAQALIAARRDPKRALELAASARQELLPLGYRAAWLATADALLKTRAH